MMVQMATHRIPPYTCIEPTELVNIAFAINALDLTSSRRDVRECLEALAIQPRVEPAHLRAARRQQAVVQERDHARERWTRRARAG